MKIPFYIGTYTEGASQGIYKVNVDIERKNMSAPVLCARECNPSYLRFDHGELWGVNECKTSLNRCGLFYYTVDSMGGLRQRIFLSQTGLQTCHFARNRAAGLAAAANYGDGSVLIIDNSGRIRRFFHSGHGPTEGRQSGPHPHSVLFSGEGKLLYAADLGTDSIWRYEIGDFDGQEGLHVRQTRFMEGDGPRQMVHGNCDKIIYCICELSGAVCTLMETGYSLKLVKRVEGCPGGAAIRRAEDGRIGCSFREKNELVIYSVQKDHLLKQAFCCPLSGRGARDFDFVAGSNLILVAYQQSDYIELCELTNDGRLEVCQRQRISMPVCVASAAA